MNADVQKILEMHKAGTVNDAQAAALLEEIMKPVGNAARGAPEGARESAAAGRGGLREPIAGVLQGALHRFFDRKWDSAGEAAGAFTSHLRENQIHLSQFDSPTGESGDFHGNEIRVSAVRRLRLVRSEMSGNRIDASKLDNVTIADGAFVQCCIQASSLDGLDVSDSRIDGVEIFTSKTARVSVGAGAALNGVKFRACSVKDLSLTAQARWSRSVVNASAISGFSIRESDLADLELNGVQMSGISVSGCRLTNLIARGLRLEDGVFMRSGFDDVLISCTDEWSLKRQAWRDVRFEDCSLRKVLFADCILSGTVVRNVSISEAKIRGRDFTGLTLDGNEAFARAAGLA